MKRLLSSTVIIGLSTAFGAYAQVSTINSAFVSPGVPHHDVPSATSVLVNNYPASISFSESGVVASSGFANSDLWQFSANGTSAYQFQNNDYFSAAYDLTVTDSSDSPRKEAGFMLTSPTQGTYQFIVNSDGHEVVQFGGSTFYSFNASQGITYNSGQTIHLGITYFQAADGNNAIQYWANGSPSPVFEFASGAGIGNGSTLGGYFQIQVAAPSQEINDGMAVFQNITIAVPEPSTLALLGLGGLALLLRRRS